MGAPLLDQICTHSTGERVKSQFSPRRSQFVYLPYLYYNAHTVRRVKGTL